jgi:hypothetical protein
VTRGFKITCTASRHAVPPGTANGRRTTSSMAEESSDRQHCGRMKQRKEWVSCALITLSIFGSAHCRGLEWVRCMGHPLEGYGSATVSICDLFWMYIWVIPWSTTGNTKKKLVQSQKKVSAFKKKVTLIKFQ